MDALDNKCPACGAAITFNPVNQLWECAYCSSKYTLDEMQQQNNSSNEVLIAEENELLKSKDREKAAEIQQILKELDI